MRHCIGRVRHLLKNFAKRSICTWEGHRGPLQLMSKLESKHDDSVNFLFKHPPETKGMLEARYVIKRNPNVRGGSRVAAYISSHFGCTMGCKFCHLTAQNQTNFVHATPRMMMQQLHAVLTHHHHQFAHTTQTRPTPLDVQRLNVNFMARGEPLANKYIRSEYPSIFSDMSDYADKCDLKLKVNISTILPSLLAAKPNWYETFKHSPVTLYWSLYSVDLDWRKRWMPNALPPKAALTHLQNFQLHTGHNIVIHFPLIDGENATDARIRDTGDFLRHSNLRAKLNIVRFNPPKGAVQKEVAPATLQRYFVELNEALGSPQESYIVPRVGRDVSASCGTFELDV